ncbi:hypothetical protein [Streptomyces sp. NPDC051162]|uniref:hypothetical protein n=1 Tax=unclassified Streptomyces TaxID=2593676 RepID=UPI003412E788
MKPIRRALTTLAASLLLTMGGAALATPAHADSHVNVLNLVGVESNGVIDVLGPGAQPILVLPNAASGII